MGKRAVRLIGTAILLVLVIPVASEFFIKLAEEKGLYSTPSQKVASAMSTLTALTDYVWFPWVFGFVLGWTVFMWGDYYVRTRESKKPKPLIAFPGIPTYIRVQFNEGTHNATLIESANIKAWHAHRQGVNILAIGERGEKLDTQNACQWLVFVVIDKPTLINQIVVDGHGMRLPNYHVESHSMFHFVLRIDGDIGSGLVDMGSRRLNSI